MGIGRWRTGVNIGDRELRNRDKYRDRRWGTWAKNLDREVGTRVKY